MPAPDVSALTDEELAETEHRVRSERFKRGLIAEVETTVTPLVIEARAVGLTEAQVNGYLARLVKKAFTATI